MARVCGPKRLLSLGVVAALALTAGPDPLGVRRAEADGAPARGRFVVLFREQADLTDARQIADRGPRRAAVLDAKRSLAERTQEPVRRLLADASAAGRAADIHPLWIVNAISFEGETVLANTIAERPEVREVQQDQQLILDPPQPAQGEPRVGTVEWNVDRIRAPQVWAGGTSGAGAVVATIDTGADFTHSAIAGQYRGTCPSAPTSHACSWFDAVNGRSAPYDDEGHGTHVLGVAVGGDGPGAFQNDIGIAYGARWIAAKAFNDQGVGWLSWILAAAQWVQAPGDDPDLAPDVVNNSWAIGRCMAVFTPLILESWRTAGILPVFSVGNLGPTSGTAESPGDLAGAFAAGATDTGDSLPAFSSRGPACDPSLAPKPDVTAPGVSIRSAAPGNAYAVASGTSSAAPHVTGTAALMVQAAGGSGVPVETLEAALRSTAIDLGEAGPDNGYGYGRIDAVLAVEAVAKTGSIAGRVLATGCRPTAGAVVSATSAVNARDVRTVTADTSGRYRVDHLAGEYSVRVVDIFGYDVPSAPTSITVPDTTTVTLDLTPGPKACGSISGTVRRNESGEALAGIEVRIEGTPIAPVTTGPAGTYSVPDVPVGTYDLRINGDRCGDPATKVEIVTVPPAPITANFDVAARRDGFGYWCAIAPTDWVPGTSPVDLAGDDRSANLSLPFPFRFYGATYTAVNVSTNGFLRFGTASAEHANGSIPSTSAPNSAVYAFWDDLVVGASAQVLSAASADAFAIEWRDVAFAYSPADRITFEAILHRNGDIELQYRTGTGTPGSGGSATIGLENADGTIGFPYSVGEATVASGLGITFSSLAAPGLLDGTVRDGGADPIQGVTITATTGGASRTTHTDANGRYRLWLPPAAYTIAASKFGYSGATGAAAVTAGQTVVQDFTMPALPRYALTGTVTEDPSGIPIQDVEIRVANPDVAPAVTDTNGAYVFSLPAGTYTLTAAPSGRCQGSRSATVTLGPSGAIQDFQIPVMRDTFGYTCREAETTTTSWSETTTTPLAGDDQSLKLSLPFSFPYYGVDYNAVFVSTNGFLRFDQGSAEPQNQSIPATTQPNLAIMALWDDLYVDPSARVYQKTAADAFAIEWRNATFLQSTWVRVTFEIILRSNGDIEIQYFSGDGSAARGAGASIGVENGNGTDGLQYSFNQPSVGPGRRLVFHPTVHRMSGTVTRTGGAPLTGATVTAVSGPRTLSTTADTTGSYSMLVPEGSYAVTASRFGYVPSTVALTVRGPTPNLNFALALAQRYRLHGTVVNSANPAEPLGGVQVRLDNPEVDPTTTVESGPGKGSYEFRVPPGTYRITADGRCAGEGGTTATVSTGDVLVDLSVPALSDSFYLCREQTVVFNPPGLIPILTSAPGVTLPDQWIPVPLPFDAAIYGKPSLLAFVSAKGLVRFDKPGTETPQSSCSSQPCIPSAAEPNQAVYPFWDDLQVDRYTQILVGSRGPDDFSIEWRLARFSGDLDGTDPNRRAWFAVTFHRNGSVDYVYMLVPDPAPPGASTVVGIEDTMGAAGLQYTRALRAGLRVTFCPRTACP